jgi:hypothetical protein
MSTEHTLTKYDAVSVVETAARYLQKGLPLSIRSDLHWEPNHTDQSLRKHMIQIARYEVVGIRRKRSWPYGVAPSDKGTKEPEEADSEIRTGIPYQLEVITQPEYVRPVDLEAHLTVSGLRTTIVSGADGHEICHVSRPDNLESAPEVNGNVLRFSVQGAETSIASKRLLVRTLNLCPEKEVEAGNYKLSERWIPKNAELRISFGDDNRALLAITYQISDENWDRLSSLKGEIDEYARANGFPNSDWPYHERENKCGGTDWSEHVPDGWYCVSFEQACRNHDHCYDTLGSNRDECDRRFHEDLIAASWKYIMRPWKQAPYEPTAKDFGIYQATAVLTGRPDIFGVPPVVAIMPNPFVPVPAHLQPWALDSLRRALVVAEIYYLIVKGFGGKYHAKAQERAREYKALVDEFVSAKYG